MKLIDEKGRLFGKVNIIDIAITVILFAGVWVMAVGYNSMVRNRREVVHGARIPINAETYIIKVLYSNKPIKIVQIGDEYMDFEVTGIKLLETKLNTLSDFIVTFEGRVFFKKGNMYHVVNWHKIQLGQQAGFFIDAIGGMIVDIEKKLEE